MNGKRNSLPAKTQPLLIGMILGKGDFVLCIFVARSRLYIFTKIPERDLQRQVQPPLLTIAALAKRGFGESVFHPLIDLKREQATAWVTGNVLGFWAGEQQSRGEMLGMGVKDPGMSKVYGWEANRTPQSVCDLCPPTGVTSGRSERPNRKEKQKKQNALLINRHHSFVHDFINQSIHADRSVSPCSCVVNMFSSCGVFRDRKGEREWSSSGLPTVRTGDLRSAFGCVR